MGRWNVARALGFFTSREHDYVHAHEINTQFELNLTWIEFTIPIHEARYLPH